MIIVIVRKVSTDLLFSTQSRETRNSRRIGKRPLWSFGPGYVQSVVGVDNGIAFSTRRSLGEETRGRNASELMNKMKKSMEGLLIF